MVGNILIFPNWCVHVVFIRILQFANDKLSRFINAKISDRSIATNSLPLFAQIVCKLINALEGKYYPAFDSALLRSASKWACLQVLFDLQIVIYVTIPYYMIIVTPNPARSISLENSCSVLLILQYNTATKLLSIKNVKFKRQCFILETKQGQQAHAMAGR